MIEPKSFRNDFNKILYKIKEKEPFAFSRFSDGELYTMQNREIYVKQDQVLIREGLHAGRWGAEDMKSFNPAGDQKYRDYLIESFKFVKKNYYKGISCKCCVGEKDWDWQFEIIDRGDPCLTWSNLLINNNYKFYVKDMLPEFKKYPIVYVCNEKANLDGLSTELNIVKDYRVGENCWINDHGLIEEMKNWVSKEDISGHLFLFSAGSLSNFLIYELYKEFNNNTYMDIGSTLNPAVGLQGCLYSREYLRGFWLNESSNPYYNQICVW